MGKIKKVVINNNGVVNVYERAGKKSANRKKLRKRIDAKQPLKPAAQEDTIKMPKDIDTKSAAFVSNCCVAIVKISAAWSQLPMLRFIRQEKHVRKYGNHSYTGHAYKDSILFNDWAYRRLKMENGMKLALFVDNVEAPKYLIIQNVVRTYEAPAHLHRLGTFTLVPTGKRDRHLCKPETITRHGTIGHKHFVQTQLPLFEHFPQLVNHQMRLWRVEEEPDLIIGYFAETDEVPRELRDKTLIRNMGLLESDTRPYTPDRDTTRLDLSTLLQPSAS